jgi:hypothetical protein
MGLSVSAIVGSAGSPRVYPCQPPRPGTPLKAQCGAAAAIGLTAWHQREPTRQSHTSRSFLGFDHTDHSDTDQREERHGGSWDLVAGDTVSRRHLGGRRDARQPWAAASPS